MDINLQLYSICEETKKNFLSTLEKVSLMNYSGVEFAGFGGIPKEEMKHTLEKLNLKGISAHVSIEELQSNLAEVIDYILTLGGNLIVCPYSEMRDEDSALKYSKIFNSIGEECLKHGIKFCYHNHEFEFQLNEGKYPIEVMLQNTNPNYVHLQPDVFWVKYAGVDPYEFLEKYKDRCPTVHFKQIAEDNHDNVDAQDGILDFFKMAKIVGEDKIFIYEQEEFPTGSPMDSVKRSSEYF